MNNYPVLGNVGYVVIDLKQMPNESSMPDFVSGNLTATIAYNAQNALGLGTESFYLPQLTDSDWQTQYSNYQFWNGKGFLRLTSLNGNVATIALYDHALNQISTVNLQVGQTFSGLSIPGVDSCSGTMQMTLNSLQNANTMAQLEINGNVMEVAQGQNLLNNQCKVLNIQQQGISDDVQINCNTDSGSQAFDLRLSPRVTLNINGQSVTAGLGDYLYTNNNLGVFLGYIGTNGKSIAGPYGYQNLKLVLIELPNQGVGSKLSNDQLASVATYMSYVGYSSVTGVSAFDLFANAVKAAVGVGQQFLKQLVQGQQIDFLDISRNTPIFGASVSITGFSSPQDQSINNPQITQNYASASTDYQSILNSYPSETYPSGSSPTLGEQALYNQIQLANNLNQKNTLSTLCANFEQRYPTSGYDVSFCNDSSSLSNQNIANQYVSINGQSYLINLRSVYEPTYTDFGAQISVKYPDSSVQTFNLIKNEIITLDNITNESIQLINLGLTPGNTVTTGGLVTPSSGTATLTITASAFAPSTKVLQENVQTTITDPKSKKNYVLTLENVNLNQYAQVTITPQVNNLGSNANFSFNIGIEKRAIQLTPDQIKNMISDLNSSIALWEKISSFTGNVIQTLNGACLATGAWLTVKNLIQNLNGPAGLARQLVMTSLWNARCQSLVANGSFVSLDQCFLNYSAQIDIDVNQTTALMQQENAERANLQAPYTTKSSLVSDNVVDTNKFLQQAFIPNVSADLGNVGSSITNPQNPSQSISISDAQKLLSNPGCNTDISLTDAENVQLYSDMLNSGSSSSTLKGMAQQGLYSTLSGIQASSSSCVSQQTLAQTLGISSNDVTITSFNPVNQIPVTSPPTFKSIPSGSQLATDISSSGISFTPTDYYKVYQESTNSQVFLIDYNTGGVVQGTYLINGNAITPYSSTQSQLASNALSANPAAAGAKSAYNPLNQKNPLQLQFKIYTASSYQNAYKNPQVQYFATAPYQGMPAIVPFDLTNGWYAAVQQALPSLPSTTSTQAYTAAGQVQSFYLCNVGPNGLEEGIAMGDDICQSINLATNQLNNQFDGLDSATTQKLVTQAVSAIQQAEKAYKSGVSNVVINGNNIKVGQPTVSIPAIECQDFMSPSDCNILFNVCDPVVCPTSRCNFGGAYPVQDVAQTGIIGSIALCFPNVREGIIIPVCLTGIKAGIDNFISVQKDYASCLQEQLNTGQTTGICDEIDSIYLCDFFWQQVMPIANIAVPKIAATVAGQNTRGGGEYLSVPNAWQTAQQSVNYLTSYYSQNALQAFGLQSTQAITASLCQDFASLTVPNGANLLNQITQPDSPPQFTGNFQAIPFTSATVPPTSQYQVFYHIYAGNNLGVTYSVYLQRSSGSSSSYYQDISATLQVDSGYINAGSSNSQTKDFTAPSGYDQLCISVNGQVDCGFQQVSTSLLSNYLQDSYLSSQANNTQITTAQDCSSANGIIRVCATGNPGNGTDPNAGAQNSRWVQVGYCGSQNLVCWLDTQGLKNLLNSPDLSAYLTNGTITTCRK